MTEELKRYEDFNEERRCDRNFTDADLDYLVSRLQSRSDEVYILGDITQEEFKEAIQFYRSFNKVVNDGKMTIYHMLLVLIVGVLFALLTEGFWSRILCKLKAASGT